MTSASEKLEITDEQLEQFRDEGYMILENALSEKELEVLRNEAQYSIERKHVEMNKAGTDKLGLSQRDKRYFIAQPSRVSEQVRDVYFGDTFATICRATLGGEVYAGWEQYVIKAADKGMKFAWHQDSAFAHRTVGDHKPGLSCWCPLDDVNEENGTIYVLPYSRMGGKKLLPHREEEGTNDLVGYEGDDPGDPVIVSAGSVVVFSSLTMHRSGPNTTDRMRRVYLAQYSPEIRYQKDGTILGGRGEPFLKDGRNVALV